MAKTIKVGVVLAAILFALGLALFPPAALASATTTAAGFTLIILALWATGLVAEYLTALIFFTGAMLLAIAPAPVIFSGFASGAFWLILGGLVLGVAINVTGLGKRIAVQVASRLNRSYAWLIGGLVISGVVFGLVMPSSLGRVVLLVPIAVTVAEQFGLHKGSNGYIGIVAATVLGTFLTGFAILPANVPNLVLSGLSETLYGYLPLYGEYLFLHFPVLGILKAVVLFLAIMLLFPDTIAHDSTAGQTEIGAVTQSEKTLAVILALLLALWVFDFLHHISPAWIAMLGACIVLLPVSKIITPQHFQQGVNFASLFYIAGILGLGQMINHTGLGTVLAQQLISILPLDPATPFVNFLSLGTLAMVTGAFTTQPGIPAVMTPFAGELATVTGFSIKAVVMSQVLGFSQPIFPYQVPPLLIGLQLAGVHLVEGFKLCLILAIASILFLFPLDYLWWQLLGWL
jgi:di/tricarboxylate transporter